MPKIKNKKVKLSKSIAQTGKIVNYNTMDQLSIGMIVEISRSDGRTHSAVVSGIKPETGMVEVEWFEANETKGKSIDFALLLRTNPNIAPLIDQNNFEKRSAKTIEQPVFKKPEPKETKELREPRLTAKAETPKSEPMTTKISRKTIHYPKQDETIAKLPESVKQTVKLTSSPAPTVGKADTYRMMDNLSIGMSVEISRSDGRMHSAVVSGIKPETSMIFVEWFEANETKGKSIDFAQLLRTNPNIAPPLLDKSNVSNVNSVNTTNNVSNVSKPKQVQRVAEPKEVKRPEPKTMPKIELNESSKPAPIVNKVQRRQIPVQKSEESIVVVPEPLRNPRQSLANVSKHQVVLKNEEIERNRMERRAQQAEEKRMREDLKGMDPGNPNWQFFKMIRDYRAKLDFRPLRSTDPIIDDRICVCVRKRPLSKKEMAKKEIEIVTIPSKDHIYLHQPKSHVDTSKYLENQKFRFDYTFDEDISNEVVYRFTAQPLVNTIFQGGFATCFAYGQTGSVISEIFKKSALPALLSSQLATSISIPLGKTHTMGGDFEGKTQDCSKGIYALCATDVFNYLSHPEYQNMGLYVMCSFFELYGSKAFDLLDKRREKKILEDKKGKVQIVGLLEEEVTSAEEVLKFIRAGSLLRVVGQTSANANSSRSHAVFQIVLKREDNREIHGKFSLIDLAGSERGADTKSSETLVRREGGEINKSLLALKECIRSMGMMKKHVPFRQSKLTLVLRDSFLGKNARTCMIATISPGLLSSENTLNTLRYANRAKELDLDAEDLNGISEEDDDAMSLDQDEIDEGQYSD